MTSHKTKGRNRLLGYIIPICLICISLIWLRQFPFNIVSPQSECVAQANFLDSNEWKLSSNDVPIRNLWQKSQNRPFLNQFDKYGLLATEDQAIFYSEYWDGSQGNILPACSEEEIISFDLTTGSVGWRYALSSQYTRPFDSLNALSDGIAVVLDGILMKFDFEGQYLWSNEGFPSRSINLVYEDKDLYLPSKNKFYVVSNETGQLVQQIEVLIPIGVLSGNIISATDDHHLVVMPIDGHTKFELPITDSSLIRSALLSQFTYSSQDVLFIFDQFGSERAIEAYSMDSGNLIWQSEDYFEGLPVLSNDRLYVYDRLSVRIIDATDGNQLGTIYLAPSSSRQLHTRSYNVTLAAYDNILIINVRDTWDIIAVEVLLGVTGE